jgi:hypothetical protein
MNPGGGAVSHSSWEEIKAQRADELTIAFQRVA